MRGARKIDLSDRGINRSWASAKGKRTAENLARRVADEFFNTIGQLLPDGAPGALLPPVAAYVVCSW